MTNLPDGLIIGAMRAGTTWVYEYLKARGDVCLPRGVKETFFFDRRFGKGVDWYAAHFRHRNREKHIRVVEVAPSYFHCNEAPTRIQGILGCPRLILIVRDPIERSISHYRHLRRRGLVSASLREAIDKFPEIVEASLYGRNIERWTAAFRESSIHVLWHDQLRSRPELFVTELCRALDIPFKPIPNHLRLRRDINSAGEPVSPWLARTGLRLANWLREHRCYAPIEFAKALGLKNIFFGFERGGKKIFVPDEEKRFLAKLVANDWEAFRNRFASKSDFRQADRELYATSE